MRAKAFRGLKDSQVSGPLGARDDDDSHVGKFALENVDRFQAAHPGQDNIEDDAVCFAASSERENDSTDAKLAVP